MKKYLLFMILSSIFFSCQKEEVKAVEGTSSSVSSQDEVSDFEETEKDESCDTKEDLEKKIEEASKEEGGLKLQGGDSGCSTDE